MKPFPLCLAASLSATLLAGCGTGSPACVSGIAIGATPAAATLSSAAPAPQNQQRFLTSETVVSLQGSCPIPAIATIVYPAWTNPDPIHIAISSAGDSTNGTAVCKGPTGGPVALVATEVSTSNTATATVHLTCQ